ncbi:hypothetical protein ABPG75_008506 [Micractinium tetrahymenae]
MAQAFLATLDVYGGSFLACCSLGWICRLATASPRDPLLLFRVATLACAFVLPYLLRRTLGLQGYARHRTRVVVLIRLLLAATPFAVGSHLPSVLSPSEDVAHVAGRLFLIAHGFSLLAAPLCFGLSPVANAGLQVVATAVAMCRAPAACACCYLRQASARASLAR